MVICDLFDLGLELIFGIFDFGIELNIFELIIAFKLFHFFCDNAVLLLVPA